jgi:hypothetical protein
MTNHEVISSFRISTLEWYFLDPELALEELGVQLVLS